MLESQSRRGFVKKVAYAAPVVATLSVMPSIASAGSRQTYNDCDTKDYKEFKNYSGFKDFKHEKDFDKLKTFGFEKTKFKFKNH